MASGIKSLIKWGANATIGTENTDKLVNTINKVQEVLQTVGDIGAQASAGLTSLKQLPQKCIKVALRAVLANATLAGKSSMSERTLLNDIRGLCAPHFPVCKESQEALVELLQSPETQATTAFLTFAEDICSRLVQTEGRWQTLVQSFEQLPSSFEAAPHATQLTQEVQQLLQTTQNLLAPPRPEIARFVGALQHLSREIQDNEPLREFADKMLREGSLLQGVPNDIAAFQAHRTFLMQTPLTEAAQKALKQAEDACNNLLKAELIVFLTATPATTELLEKAKEWAEHCSNTVLGTDISDRVEAIHEFICALQEIILDPKIQKDIDVLLNTPGIPSDKLKTLIAADTMQADSSLRIDAFFKSHQVYLGSICLSAPDAVENIPSLTPLDSLATETRNLQKDILHNEQSSDATVETPQTRHADLEKESNEAVKTFCTNSANYLGLELCRLTLGGIEGDMRTHASNPMAFLESGQPHFLQYWMRKMVFNIGQKLSYQIIKQILLGNDFSQDGMIQTIRRVLKNPSTTSLILHKAIGDLTNYFKEDRAWTAADKAVIHKKLLQLQSFIVDHYTTRPDFSVWGHRAPLLTSSLESLCWLIKRSVLKLYLYMVSFLPTQVETLIKTLHTYPLPVNQSALEFLNSLLSEQPEGEQLMPQYDLSKESRWQKSPQELAKAFLQFSTGVPTDTQHNPLTDPLAYIQEMFDKNLTEQILPEHIQIALNSIFSTRMELFEEQTERTFTSLNTAVTTAPPLPDATDRELYPDEFVENQNVDVRIQETSKNAVSKLVDSAWESTWTHYGERLHIRSQTLIDEVLKATEELQTLIGDFIDSEETSISAVVEGLQHYSRRLLSTDRQVFEHVLAEMGQYVNQTQAPLQNIIQATRLIHQADKTRKDTSTIIEECQQLHRLFQSDLAQFSTTLEEFSGYPEIKEQYRNYQRNEADICALKSKFETARALSEKMGDLARLQATESDESQTTQNPVPPAASKWNLLRNLLRANSHQTHSSLSTKESLQRDIAELQALLPANEHANPEQAAEVYDKKISEKNQINETLKKSINLLIESEITSHAESVSALTEKILETKQKMRTENSELARAKSNFSLKNTVVLKLPPKISLLVTEVDLEGKLKDGVLRKRLMDMIQTPRKALLSEEKHVYRLIGYAADLIVQS